MWTKKLKINEIQSNILMYGEICGKEEIREISNREVIFSDRLLAYAGWHAAVHVPVFTILSTYIMKQIGNFFFKSLKKKTDYIILVFFKQKVFVKEHYLFSVRYGGYVTLKHTFSVNKTFSMMNLRTVYICNVDKILDMTKTL